jgi:hypothetical protein
LIRFLLLLCACEPMFPERQRNWDVRGEYALAYADHVTLSLESGGTVRRTTAPETGSVNVGGLVVDVGAFAPSQILGSHAGVDQSDVDLDLTRHDIVVGGYSGIVDHAAQDEFSASGAGSDCHPLVVLTGRFTHRGETVRQEPEWRDADGGACAPLDGGTCALATIAAGVTWPGDAPVDGISQGRVAGYWPAACASAGANGRLLIEVGFTGARIGDFEPMDAAVAGSD